MCIYGQAWQKLKPYVFVTASFVFVYCLRDIPLSMSDSQLRVLIFIKNKLNTDQQLLLALACYYKFRKPNTPRKLIAFVKMAL